MKFDEYMRLNESDESKRTFCYMVYADTPYKEQLLALQQSLNITSQELVPINEFHCTIRYVKLSGEQSPKLFTQWLETQQLPLLEAFTSGFSMFKDGALVLTLDSPQLQEWFDKIDSWMTDSGGYKKSDYPTYKPHITLAYNTTSPLPVYDPRSHRLNVKFSIHKVTDTNHNVVLERRVQGWKGQEYGSVSQQKS